MRFEWNSAKSEDCQRRRGFNFAFASRIFEADHTLEWEDSSSQGERRYNVAGPIEDHIYVVTYTERADVTRIISARRADKAEEQAWRESV